MNIALEFHDIASVNRSADIDDRAVLVANDASNNTQG
jgi:hypothetical protein